MNHKTIIPTSISILLFTVCLQAQNQGNSIQTQFRMPAGYHELLESPANGKPMQRAVYDFDQDGQDDYALFIADIVSGVSYRLLLYLSKTDAYIMIYLYEEQCYPVQLKVRKNVMEYAYYLAGTGGYIRTIKLRYNDDAGMMQVIGYDSGYRIYRNLGGYCTKSYNLLTGDLRL